MYLIRKFIQFIYRLGNRYNYLYNKILINKHRVKVSNNTINNFRGIIFVQNNGIIKIEDDVTINSKYKNNPIGGQGFTSLVVGNGAELVIKKRVGISNSAIVANKKIVIEEDVFIGGDCKIYDTDFHSIDFQMRTSIKDVTVKMAEVNIKKGAFIGTGTIILKGVTVGEYSIVGAGSVVTKDIPSMQIWGGNPAKFIKDL